MRRNLDENDGDWITFTIPVKPMGVNHAYVPAKFGKRYGLRMTSEGHAYKEAISKAARAAMAGRERFAGFVEIFLDLVYPDNRSDIDGSIKLDLDAIQGIVYGNDRQIVSLTVYKRVDRENPRISYSVSEAPIHTRLGDVASAIRRKSDDFKARSGRLAPAKHDYRDFHGGDRSKEKNPSSVWGDIWDRPVKIPDRV